MNSFQLKILALITMIIDHIGIVFFPNILVFRFIGRISFPIYCFLISLGLKYTKNYKKYILRLFLFAIISEPFYDLCFGFKLDFFSKTNVIYTLFLGTVSIILYNKIKNKFIRIITLILFLYLAFLLNTDYSYLGVLLIYIFYFSKTKFQILYYGLFWVILKNINGINTIIFNNVPINYIQNIIMFFVFTYLAFFIILRYNNKKGKSLKYLFYISYPLHLFIFYILKVIL